MASRSPPFSASSRQSIGSRRILGHRSAKKLTGHALFRIRVGVYRVVYETRGDELIVIIVKVGHRREVYDRYRRRRP